MDGMAFVSAVKIPTSPAEGGVDLKRQEEVKHAINGLEARWQGIEADHLGYWTHSGNELKSKFRPEVYEKLKNEPLISGELPPLGADLKAESLNTQGIPLTREELQLVQYRADKFKQAQGDLNGRWGDIRKDFKKLNLRSEEIDNIQKTDNHFLLKDDIPPSYTKAKSDYKAEQERKAKDEADLRRFREKEKEQQSLGTRMDQALAPKELPPSINRFDIDGALTRSPNNPNARLNSFETPPTLTTNSFDKHLLPHTAVMQQTASENFSNIPNGGITNPIEKGAVPLGSPAPPLAMSGTPNSYTSLPTGNSFPPQTPPIKTY